MMSQMRQENERGMERLKQCGGIAFLSCPTVKGGVSQGTRLRVSVSDFLGEGDTCILPPAPILFSARKKKKKTKAKTQYPIN